MLVPARRAAVARVTLLSASLLNLMLLGACSGSSAFGRTVSPPPRAEFLLSSADSTFWVATTSGQLRVRGVPLVLARYDNRFYEVYGTDDDRSYNDALLLGERIYRRDLITGDSVLVFADTTVPRIAEEYARAHPDERPLAPDDDGEANPSTSATAEIDILDVHGPYLSYEYHVDVSLPGRDSWHTTRNGVIDLRSGKESHVADVFGLPAGNQLLASARREFGDIRDSVIRERPTMDEDDQRAADALSSRAFDDRSFRLSSDAGHPSVTFTIPGAGHGAEGSAVELEPLEPDSGIAIKSWWSTVSTGLARTDDADDDVWLGNGYRVFARYDTSGDVANVSIADSSGREWSVANVLAPLRRIDWLDQPAASDVERKALMRAFNQAATYDQTARVASQSVTRSRRSQNLQLVALHAPRQASSRKSPRNVGTHDAGTCQQSRACVRGRHSRTDRQDRSHRGV